MTFQPAGAATIAAKTPASETARRNQPLQSFDLLVGPLSFSQAARRGLAFYLLSDGIACRAFLPSPSAGLPSGGAPRGAVSGPCAGRG